MHSAAELAAYKTGLIKQAAEPDGDKFLRLAAEFDNYKKRTARQFAELVKNANEELIVELLAILDDFKRALETNSSRDSVEQNQSYLDGMKMIYDKFLSVLKARGVVQFEPTGQPFDPQFHDAVMQMPSEQEEGTVVGVISPGYTLNEKVIRHAKVIVASSK